MEINKVGVVGCGLMGHGIVQVAAQGGCDVVALEMDQAALDRGLARVDKSLALGYVAPEYHDPERDFSVEILGDMRGAELAPRPVYDPAGQRMKS